MRNVCVLSLVLSVMASQAAASYQCNAHGAVVTADNGQTYYVGRSCDAAKEGGGEGRWWFTASAMAVEINGTVEALIRFDVECDLPYCTPS